MTDTKPVEAPADPNEVRLTINGREVVARKGDLVIAAAQRAGDYIPRFCYHERMNSVGMCRMCLVDVDTGRGPGLQPSCMITVAPGMVVDTQSAAALARPGRHHRAAARQSSARLPGLRQGRRVSVAGSGVQPRAGRESVRRREAPLRKADTHQRSGAARPRALHPVRSLHPLRRRGRRRRPDPLHESRQRHPDHDVPRRAVRQLLQRQHRADLPGRCAHGQALPVQGPAVGSRTGREHLHHVRRGLPHRRAVEPRRVAALPGRRQRSGELGLAVRPRPVQLRGGQQSRSTELAAGPRRRRTATNDMECAHWPAPPN